MENPTVSFLGSIRRVGGDGEELHITLTVPQTEIPRMHDLLVWGKCELDVTVVKKN